MAERENEEFFIFHGHIHKVPKHCNLEENPNSDNEHGGDKEN